jgi:hypothetical protein
MKTEPEKTDLLKDQLKYLVGPEKGTLRYHRQKLIPGCRDEQGTQEVE